ncbi:MAG: MmcQ/YjbR family DNA-binding protein [Gammaproteobacteria bacterium]|nr:MAG: MmcQ/YjbR family DNA-binding protein [Gammaproteobacteria bacterium]
MSRTLIDVLREICLGLPEVEEAPAHRMPEYRVNGKTFATLAINHHGDGHEAVWLKLPAGGQEHYTEREPRTSKCRPMSVRAAGWGWSSLRG